MRDVRIVRWMLSTLGTMEFDSRVAKVGYLDA